MKRYRSSVLAGLLIWLLPGVGLVHWPTVQAERLTASWYGLESPGPYTASGERWNPMGLTAASRTLPFGTQLTVMNPANGRMVRVTVNDRGPFEPSCLPKLCPHPTRSLDLSQGAAERLGMIKQGIAEVIVWRNLQQR